MRLSVIRDSAWVPWKPDLSGDLNCRMNFRVMSLRPFKRLLPWFPYPDWPFISRVWRLVETSFMIHNLKMNELRESSQIWKDWLCLHTKHFGNTPCAAGISHTFPAAAIVRNGHPRLAGWHWGMAVLDMGIEWNFSLILLMVQKSGVHQLRLVVYPPVSYNVFLHPRWLFGISSINSTWADLLTSFSEAPTQPTTALARKTRSEIWIWSEWNLNQKSFCIWKVTA